MIEADMAMMQEPPEVSTRRSLRDRLRGRGKVRTLEPNWLEGPFDELARGLWVEGEVEFRRERGLATRWTWLQYTLGLLAVVLAAVAGFGGLADLLSKKGIALIALVSGVATAVVTFLQAESKRQQHAQRATAWDSYRDEITTIVVSRPPTPDGAEAPVGWQQLINALRTRATALRGNQADPLTAPRSWPKPPRVTKSRPADGVSPESN